jgi:hypothetical protein
MYVENPFAISTFNPFAISTFNSFAISTFNLGRLREFHSIDDCIHEYRAVVRKRRSATACCVVSAPGDKD